MDREAHDDTFGLIPDELQRQLDAETRKLERAIGGKEDESETIREMELMDHLIDHSDGEPVWSILDAPSKLPHPDDLDDQQIEGILKSILVQLALLGIALDVCEHCTPRDAYRMLIERVLKEERFHPELRQTQWVQHFMTHDFCKQCEVEAEKKYVTGQPVNLRFSIRNQSDRTLYILTWYTPLEGIAGEIFSVTRDGEAVPYRGIMAKRGDPSRDEYTVVQPRAEASVVVDLAEEYDLSRAGRYQVEFTSRLHDVTDDESAVPRKRDDHRPQDLRCSTAAFEVARADD